MPQKWRTLPRFFSPLSSSFRPRPFLTANHNRNPAALPTAPSFLRAPHRFKPSFQVSNAFPRSLCYRCGGEGHLARSCLIPVICFSCGASGHKRLECPNLEIQKSAHLPFQELRDEGVVEALLLRSSWTEPNYHDDSFLLDPDVMAYRENKILSPADLGKLGSLEKEQVVEHRSLELKSGVVRSGLLSSGIMLDKVKGIGPSHFLSFCQNFLLHRGLSKGRRYMASFCQKENDNNWSTIGKGSLFLPISSVFSLRYPSSLCGKYRSEQALVDPFNLEERNSDISAGHKKWDKSPTGTDLPPAPFDVIAAFVFLDDSGVFCNKEERDPITYPSSHSSSKIKDMEEGIHLKDKVGMVQSNSEFMKKNETPFLKEQGSGPPIGVRRSPRLLAK